MTSRTQIPATSQARRPPTVVTAQVIPDPNAGETPEGTSTMRQSLSGTQFSSLLSAIQNSEQRLDDKLAGFKADVRQAQEDAAAKAVTRAQLEKPYNYKKKAHEEQARFNDQVSACIREAQGSIGTSDETPAQKRAQEALEKGAQLLAERQKLIKIADRSENGWGVVAEYTADELADDSDDEKRIEKAEKAAERKAGLRKRKRAQQQQPKFPRFPRRERGNLYNLSFPSPALQWKPQQTLPVATGIGGRRASPTTPRAVGPCFACGEMGHLRTYCPKM